jgi:hypothetical protein
MKEIVRVYLSSNGKEFMVYDGSDELLYVVPVNEPNRVGSLISGVLTESE